MLEIILAILATYRIARMIAIEEGAFGVFEWVRSKVDPRQNTWLGRGMNCPMCISFWVALAFTFLIQVASLQLFLVTWLGIAGGAVIVYQVVDQWEK